MDGIDSASNTEELINSIRGKAQPLEARVQELATFVGEEDAMRTPESVLTMVQPVIMMTEEGAIDSGIGELMQGVMGDTEMSADMGQGVGALMAQRSACTRNGPTNGTPTSDACGYAAYGTSSTNGASAYGTTAAVRGWRASSTYGGGR